MRKHRSDKHRPRSEWSEWIWSEEHGTWYHVRQRSNGEWLYEDQNGQALGGAAAEDSATPRQDMDDLVQGLSTLSTNAEDDFEADDGLGEASTQQTEYQFTNATHESDRSRRHRHKGKNKHVTYEDVLEQEQVPEPEGAGAYEPNPGPEVNPTSVYGALDISNDPEIAQLLEENPELSTFYPQKGASSSRGASASVNPRDRQAAQQDHISGDGQVGDREVLDKRYKVHKSKYFQVGEVFKVLWPEPMGVMAGAPTLSDRDALRDRYGGLVHVGFRRFIVIATDEGHSTCVPILTYGGQGCRKKGVKPRHHGIIYTSKEPLMLEGEPTLGAPPARMEVTTKGEKLSKSSRANYSKMMTVEHNVKVMFIGRIGADYPVVYTAINDCWDNKDHHRQDNDDGQAM
ncbi:hypothetical protein HYQ45_001990 [Verticillium longisporum]|uniref:DUF6590 domain-containing protein n=1 Tax=Verticillium longisporum TaxID=100787 RepID=A0A8I3AYH1_VERLO|nr:hypothetical protein HYQ45_001990 [Verticillium longisporum]KAH6664552.1 hypothetical protein EV126DRAFT_219084 [Verticillium dahliae]